MPHRPTVLLLTESRHPRLTPDDLPLLEAFQRAGCAAAPAIWSDPLPDADFAVIRSTWDYTTRPAAFLAALDAIGRRMKLWNPADTVRWNADKRYLLELADQGIPLPASKVVAAGSDVSLASLVRDIGSDRLVIKPVIGASGVDTWLSGAGEEQRWLAASAQCDLLVQAFVPEVVETGEWSLVYLGGRFSHAVLKRARTGEFRVQEQYGGVTELRDPPSTLRAGAERALAAVPRPWCYARVDGVAVAGNFVLMEMELIEPVLFFGLAPDAARKLATAILTA